MDWIDLANDGEKWWAVVKVVMDFRVPYNSENFVD